MVLFDALDQAVLDSFLDLWLPVSIGTPCALASLCWVFCHLQLAEPRRWGGETPEGSECVGGMPPIQRHLLLRRTSQPQSRSGSSTLLRTTCKTAAITLAAQTRKSGR